MFKKYQWYDETLHKKYSRFNWFALASMALAIVSLKFFPAVLQMANIAFIVGAAVLLWLAMRVQSQDKKLKVNSKGDIRG
jgi:hypothetical protein